MGRQTREELFERDVRLLCRILTRKGVMVRREKLIRGSAFRAKSAPCRFQGESFLFVDRNLPAEQQLSFLVDYITARHLTLSDDDLSELTIAPKALLTGVGESALSAA